MKNSGSFKLPHSSGEVTDAVINTISKEISCSEIPFQNEDMKEPAWKCRNLVTLIGFLVLLLASTHRTIMSVVIVAMVNNTAIIRNSKAESLSCMDLISNSTENTTIHGFRKKDGEFIWSSEIQGYILGCYFFGNVLSQIPAGRLGERYGCKWTIVGSLIATSVLTMLVPPFSYLSASAVIVMQGLRGFAQGMLGPCIVILMANWCPKTERGFLYSLTLTSNSLGPALGAIVSGYVSELSSGWSYALYSVGGSGLVLAAYFSFFISENPKGHPRISKAELNFILSSQENNLSRRRPKLPYRQLLRSVPVYALIVAVFGRSWKYSQFFVVHSTFLGTILHLPIGQNGLFSAIPFLISFLTSILSSWISGHLEKKEIISVNFIRKFWHFISGSLYSLCLLGIYFSGCDRNLSEIFAILSMGATGLGNPGSAVTLQDMSPTFAGTLYSVSTTIGLTASIMLPLIVGYLTNEMQTLEQWNKVFFISIGVVMSSSIVFAVFGSAKLQPWNFVEENDKTNEKQTGKDKNEEITRI